MSKPTIFFSHSSADKDVLSKLKELFCEKTGGTIDVFLSSDGQSIPLGRNWVHRIQEALDEAEIMVVFLTPNSLRSSWIYFEAGYAYSKNIRVVPVGFLGADLASIAPPLSLLQGFNIVNKDGLDNLIALANDTFSHNHKSLFTEEEYQTLMLEGNRFMAHPLGELSRLVDEIHIEVTERDNLVCTPEEGVVFAQELFEKNGYEYKTGENYIEGYGLRVYTTDNQHPKPIKFILDPALIDNTFPLALEVIRRVRNDGIKGIPIHFIFVNGVDCINKSHKLTARLYGTGVTLGKERSLAYEGLDFTIDHLIGIRAPGRIKQGATYLSITPIENDFDLSRVADLMKLLIKTGVLYETEECFEVQ